MSTNQINFIVKEKPFEFLSNIFLSEHEFSCYWDCCKCNYCHKHNAWCDRKTIGDWYCYCKSVWQERDAWMPSWLLR